MRSSHLFRIALHLLLAAGLVLPGIAAPAQAMTQELAAAGAGGTMAHSPCDGMQMPSSGKAPTQLPAGAQHGCDLSACLGAACLPTLPHVPAFIPEADMLITWDQPMPPSRQVDTPLRPPIV